MKAIIPCLTLIFVGIAGADTITEYFKRIPRQEFTEGTPVQLVDYAKDGQGLIDIKNGYFSLEGDGAQVSLQVALFRYENKEPLLVVAWGFLEEEDFTNLTIFQENGGKMVVADRKIFPVANSEEVIFELPRHGRTVIVKNSAGAVLSKWTWDGAAFRK